MEFILDSIAHRIGVSVLNLLSGGRFKGRATMHGAGRSPSAIWFRLLNSRLSSFGLYVAVAIGLITTLW